MKRHTKKNGGIIIRTTKRKDVDATDKKMFSRSRNYIYLSNFARSELEEKQSRCFPVVEISKKKKVFKKKFLLGTVRAV